MPRAPLLTDFAARQGLPDGDHHALWRWSVDDPDAFWSAVWEFFGVLGDRDPAAPALADARMPGALWFPGARLNYAENALAGDGHPDDPDDPDDTALAVVARSQTRGPVDLTRGELREQVARARAGLVRLGVGEGDRVAAYLPNIPETLVAFLATASLGAIWSSCAPEFGARSVVDRFAQIEPVVLLAVGGYRYGDRDIDRRDELAAVRDRLPTVRHVVEVPYPERTVPDALGWAELLAEPGPLEFARVPFDHPLWVLFSSGTTGLPKAIVHGHGGILLEQLKNHGLALDSRPGDRVLWFTTTAWTMWNIVVSALLTRAAVVLVDGDLAWPDLDAPWATAAETGATLMGTSPAYLMSCRKAGLRPAADHDLTALRHLGVTGSPLPAEGFDWVAEQLGDRVLLDPMSGGTDVCSGFVGGGPWLPVRRGRIAGPCLGVDVTAFDPDDPAGREVVGEQGELVVRAPMPSMPVCFWNDPGDERYREAYFDVWPGVWRHGDWVTFDPDGSAVISGRSDATLNRGGVRLGTAEFYAVVEDFGEVRDSLVVHLEDDEGGAGRLLLFVVPDPGADLDDLATRLRSALRRELSPRHVPDEIAAVPAVPRTLTGKKLETPVKRILQGRAAGEVVSRDALVDPDALAPFIAGRHRPPRPPGPAVDGEGPRR